jgi:hypothetical protein
VFELKGSPGDNGSGHVNTCLGVDRVFVKERGSAYRPVPDRECDSSTYENADTVLIVRRTHQETYAQM